MGERDAGWKSAAWGECGRRKRCHQDSGVKSGAFSRDEKKKADKIFCEVHLDHLYVACLTCISEEARRYVKGVEKADATRVVTLSLVIE